MVFFLYKMGEIKEIICHAYEWILEDSEDPDSLVNIRCWAFEKESSNPILIKINSFPVSCYIELPPVVRGVPKRYWDEGEVSDIMATLSRMLESSGHSPINYKYAPSRKIYYRRDRLSPMIYTTFRSQEARKHCENLIKKNLEFGQYGRLKLVMHETDISTVVKLLALKKMKFSQWFRFKYVEGIIDTTYNMDCDSLEYRREKERIRKIKESLVPNQERGIEIVDTSDKIADDNIREFRIRHSNIDPISEEESKSWITRPKLLSIDAEVYSSNERRFPNENIPKDVIYMLSCIFSTVGSNDEKNYVILLGDCDATDEAEVIRVRSEKELIEEFAKLVERLNPDIFIGYNILGFDFKYMNTRLRRRGYKWPKLGRIKGQDTYVKESKWKSGAYGINENYILKAEGRINLDVMLPIKRDFKLVNYKLDTVAKHFLGIQKIDLSPVAMFRYYKSLLESRAELGKLTLLKDVGDVSEHDLETARLEYSKSMKDITKIVEYCVRDSALVTRLFNKLNLWVQLVEMSNVACIPISDVTTRGQQIRVYNKIASKAFEKKIVIAKRPPSEKLKPPGGHVEEPIPGIYDNAICVDFKSMYPSIIRSENICYTTLIPYEDYDRYKPEEYNEFVVKPLLITTEHPKGIEKEMIVRFYKGEKGILPDICEEFVSSREAVRAVLDARIKEKDGCQDKEKIKELEHEINILNARQLAIKVAANSVFGFTGAKEGRLPLMEAMASVTTKGQELIGDVYQFLEVRFNAKLIYSDTDSAIVDVGIKDTKVCSKMGKRIIQAINGTKPGDLDPEGIPYTEENCFKPLLSGIAYYVDFEKAMRMIIFKKKKYAAYFIDDNGEFKKKKGTTKVDLLVRGILIARRDNCKYARDAYEELLLHIMNMGDIMGAIDIILKNIRKLRNGEVSLEDLLIVKSVSATYKNDAYMMKVFTDNLRNQGKPVAGGERLSYLVVDTGNPKEKIGNKMRLLEQYKENRRSEEKRESIDYDYYIYNLLESHIDQLFQTGYRQIIEEKELDTHGLKAPRRKIKVIPFSSPIAYIAQLQKDGEEPEMYKEDICDYLESY